MQITAHNDGLLTLIHDDRGLIMTGCAGVCTEHEDGAVGYLLTDCHRPKHLSVRLFFPSPRPSFIPVRIEENGATCTSYLDDCFPGEENDNDFWEAYGDLMRTGEYVGGGGAASSYVLKLVDELEPSDVRDNLIREYQAWYRREDFPSSPGADAYELLAEDFLTPDQRAYLNGFVERWEEVV